MNTPKTDEQLAALGKAVRAQHHFRMSATSAERNAVKRQRAVIDALELGVRPSELAKAMKLSDQRVAQISKEAQDAPA